MDMNTHICEFVTEETEGKIAIRCKECKQRKWIKWAIEGICDFCIDLKPLENLQFISKIKSESVLEVLMESKLKERNRRLYKGDLVCNKCLKKAEENAVMEEL